VKKNVLITGASGMIGSLIVQLALDDSSVEKVKVLVRNSVGISHSKLIELIHQDFLDYNEIEDQFNDIDICFYCLGVYTGAVPKEEFRKITVDFTKSFTDVLQQKSPTARICFLSGQGADPTERSSIMFAKDKGAAENILTGCRFSEVFIFRPGYIYPDKRRKEPNSMYSFLRLLYKPILSKVYPNIGITSSKLARVMYNVGKKGADQAVFENKDIRTFPD
jgi:nucleoside-diphosphate-sugar epimerase